MYVYKALVLKVIDGDTVDLKVDLGFHIHVDMRIRMAGINAPELHSKDPTVVVSAQTAKVYLKQRIELKTVTLMTIKDRREKYGRILGLIFLDDVDINQELVDAGLAVVSAA